MAITYDTLGATVTVEPTGAVAPADLNTSVAIVGAYDSANGSVTAGEATTVVGTSDADEQFGANSELARATAVAINNGAGTVYGVALPETQTTESFAASSSGTLGSVPVMDPRVTSKTITAQDTSAASSVEVNAVYGTPQTPSPSNTINLNPVTGAWKADTSSDYDITYTYGDYDAALTEAVKQPVRMVSVGTEESSVITTLQTKLTEQANNFRFLRGVVGATPDLQSGDVSSYTPQTDDQRLVEVAPARATGSDGGVRTCHAIAGLLANQPIDVTGSITYDAVGGLTDLNVAYAPTTAESFERVTALTDEYEVAEGVTTSSKSAFSDVYKVEIIDLVVEQLYARVKEYSGGPNTDSAQRSFASRLKRLLSSQSAPTAQPPLLADGEGGQPYSVTVSTGANDTVTDVNIGIDVAPIAKQVNLAINVGPIRFGGASV